MLKNKKGITLVALVVTIIILLILAGVSIATLTDSGLFEKAKEAKAKSENAQNEENSILSQYENAMNSYLSGIGKNTVESYTVKYDANGGTGIMEDSQNIVSQNTFIGEDGQVFKNWNTLPNGNGAVYNFGDKVNRDVTLYAQWEFSNIANYDFWFNGSDRCTAVSGGWVGGYSQGRGKVTDNQEYVTMEDTYSNNTWSYTNYVAQKKLTEKECSDTKILIYYEIVTPFHSVNSGFEFRIKKDNTATYNNNWEYYAAKVMVRLSARKCRKKYRNCTVK